MVALVMHCLRLPDLGARDEGVSMRTMNFNSLRLMALASLTMMVAAEASAGSMQTVCRRSRNAVVFATGNFSMNVVRSTPDSLQVGELSDVLEFKADSRAPIFTPCSTTERMGEIVVKSVGRERMVAKEGGEPCPDGNGGMTAHGPGSETHAFPASIELNMSGLTETVQVTCRTTVGFSGRCVFEE